MPLQHQFICPLPNGVHARPASLLEEVSRCFDSTLTLTNQRTGREANGKSVLSIIGADIRHNDPCLLTVSGSDERDALTRMSVFLDQTFPRCDDALAMVSKSNGKPHRLPSLCDAGAIHQAGIPVVSGIGCGRIVRLGGFKMPATLATDGVKNPDAEWRLLDESLKKLLVFYDEHLARAHGRIEASLFKAHRAIARDVEFRRELQKAVVQRNRTTAGAVADAQAFFSNMLVASGSDLLRERALDIQDVCTQLLRQVYGDAVDSKEIQLTTESIVLAETLTPGQFLALDRRLLKGLVLAHAGVTSHTIILARSFGIPTLVGFNAAPNLDGQEAIVDADAGGLITQLAGRARRYYEMEQRRLADRQAHVRKFCAQPGKTKDGRRIEIAANVASADEVSPAFAAGAEVIGLFRTEMLFCDRDAPPGEEEQFQTYCQALKAASGRTVIIRTLDVGGDKPLDYLKLPVEENPFLGYRAVRVYPRFESLIRTQIRALIRASAQGRLKILIPMIATLEEVRWVKQIITEEQTKCAEQKIKFNATLPVGAMIEVPAAAFALDKLCRELDFFSIGSNDLLQYFMAADRTNDRVASLYHPLQPAFLRLLKQIVDQVHSHKKWIGLCGEMGGQTQLLPLLVGLGLDEISVATPAIPALKAELAERTTLECKQLLADALDCATADEIKTILESAAIRSDVPLLEPELVLVNERAATKAEAIKLATDRLYVLGRAENSRQLEEAVWQREQTYSTGFGHGFAIPHGKSNAVRFNSLVLVKLKTPVDWNALDEKPVGIIILLAINEHSGSNQHMKVLAKLARQIMDENFRAQLATETDQQTLYQLLQKRLE